MYDMVYYYLFVLKMKIVELFINSRVIYGRKLIYKIFIMLNDICIKYRFNWNYIIFFL